MNKSVAVTTLVILIASAPGSGQIPPGMKVGLVPYIQASFGGIAQSLQAAAERMPAEGYGFKPSSMPEARTFGAVIAHAADGMFAACSTARGVPNPGESVETSAADKETIGKALRQAVAFCQEAVTSLTDESSAQYVRQGQGEVVRGAVLVGLLAHSAEVFGISTVYLRARNLVPPGSDK